MATASGLAARRAFRPLFLTIVGIIAILDLLLAGGIAALSGTRAYVGGESLWAKGAAVLVVEDEQSVRDLVRQVLVRHRYHVTVADSAEDALKPSSPCGSESISC